MGDGDKVGSVGFGVVGVGNIVSCVGDVRFVWYDKVLKEEKGIR